MVSTKFPSRYVFYKKFRYGESDHGPRIRTEIGEPAFIIDAERNKVLYQGSAGLGISCARRLYEPKEKD